MAGQGLIFAGLTERDRQLFAAQPKFAAGQSIELHVRDKDGQTRVVNLPKDAADAVEARIEKLSHGEKVAVVTETPEASPSDASRIFGVSRPVVVHRMDRGDLPFRYVGKHRRALLKDVLALKARLDAQRNALRALAAYVAEFCEKYGA